MNHTPSPIGVGVFAACIKGLRRDVEHSILSEAEIKKEWSHTSFPSARLHVLGRESIFLPSLYSLCRRIDGRKIRSWCAGEGEYVPSVVTERN
jgi:hypothetical protein